MRQRTNLMIVGVVLLLGSLALPAGAEGGRRTITPAPDVQLGSVLVSSGEAGTQSIPCKAVSPTRIECLNAEGTGMVGILNLTPPIEPRSASGTNGDIHITVIGSGLSVTSWETRARQYRTDGCIDHDAYFYGIRPGTSYPYWITTYFYNGPCVQVPFPFDSIDWWTTGDDGQAGSYTNGTRLCNGWQPSSKLSGFPCITVHD